MSQFTITKRTGTRSKIRPVYIMFESGISTNHMNTVVNAVNELLEVANATSFIKVQNFGVWRNSNYRQNGKLTEWSSVDWYVEDARSISRPGQIDCERLVTNLLIEPWQKQTPHYDLLVLKSDLYARNTNFVLGLAQHHGASALSIHRLLGLENRLQHECIKTIVMHEMGHVFGLIPPERTHNVEESLGKHCTNRCLMRQGLRVPHDWINITQDRLKYGPFCTTCTKDLREYFFKPY